MELSWTLSPTHFKQRKIICHTVPTARITEPSPIWGQWGWDGFLHIFIQATHTFHCPLLDLLLSCFCGKTTSLCSGNLVGERQLFGHAMPLFHVFLLSISQLTKGECRTRHTGTLIFGEGAPKEASHSLLQEPRCHPSMVCFIKLLSFIYKNRIERKGEKATHAVFLSPYQSQAELPVSCSL